MVSVKICYQEDGGHFEHLLKKSWLSTLSNVPILAFMFTEVRYLLKWPSYKRLKIVILIRVGPDIRQCRIIRPDIRLSGNNKPDIRQYPARQPDNSAGYPASGKKNHIRLNPNFNRNTLSYTFRIIVAYIRLKKDCFFKQREEFNGICFIHRISIKMV